jgi:hypothetical protein
MRLMFACTVDDTQNDERPVCILHFAIPRRHGRHVIDQLFTTLSSTSETISYDATFTAETMDHDYDGHDILIFLQVGHYPVHLSILFTILEARDCCTSNSVGCTIRHPPLSLSFS